MVFCSSCGKELPEGAYFCPKCGIRTKTGAKAGAKSPWEEVREAFSMMGAELEKAFETAGKEIEKAFKTAKEEIKQASSKEPVVCPDCGIKNVARSKFCYKCGKKLD